MKIEWTRTTTIVEKGEVDIPDGTEGLEEYVRAAKRGVERMMVNPQPASWRTTRRTVTYQGEPMADGTIPKPRSSTPDGRTR